MGKVWKVKDHLAMKEKGILYETQFTVVRMCKLIFEY